MLIAEAAALAGLRWVASSSVISKLVNDSISYLGCDIARGLEDLETTLLPQIQLTIEAAQHSPHKAPLARWLARLKNAYYDAEGILHELEYDRLKRKAKGVDNKLLVRLSSKPIIKPLAKLVKKTSLFSPQKRKLFKRLKKLKEVAEEAKNLRDLLNDLKYVAAEDKIENIHNVDKNPFVTSSVLSNADKVFGRDKERDEIIKFLLDEQGSTSLRKSYSVVAITGMGGAGKTTLAQYIYNDQRVKNHFSVRMWLCLSRIFDINEVTKEMIDCASGIKCPDHGRNLSNLQEELIKTLPDHINVMVVLDDVWYDNNDGAVAENQWENLLKPFDSRGGTCKIMVTSRSSWSFPIELQPGKHIQLRDLTHDDFKSLLRYRAIDGLQISNPQINNDLSYMSDIVDQIAEKMSKLPLAAKVVGNQLRQQPNIKFWQDTLANVNLSNIMEILLWSFHRFDVQLQRCFLFCSIFPKGTRYGLDSLMPYWVALDFIQSSDDNENVEDIAFKYFLKMVANSIFHLVDKKYIMHDLFHDLAEKLSGEDCFRVTNYEREVPITVQHVYVEINNENLKENLHSICNLSNLRTLILRNPFINDISEIISMISTKFRNLRVLDIGSRGYKILPRGIGDLKNLRLLNFAKSSVEELPDSILQHYHLQILWLPSSIKTLPTKLSNFINLRLIEMYNTYGVQVNTLPAVPYVGKLTSLQRLDEFHVRIDRGYELQQLGPLKEIGGPLKIINLENVQSTNEAVEARLIDKPKLKSLELVWAGTSAEINCSEIEVIEALQPPKNLELLKIDGYKGSRYPTWLQEGSFIDNIKGVMFRNCNTLTVLPQNFHQFHHCSELVLENLGALIELSTIPESLATLSIIKCPSLICVCENELQVNENQSIMKSQFLEFSIEGCRDILDHELKIFKQIVSPDNFEEQLQILESAARGNAPKCSVNRAWWTCHQQRMNFIFRCNTPANKLKLPSMLRVLYLVKCCVSDGALTDCLSGMATLEELYLEGIMTITTLPPIQVSESLQSLRVVEIKQCWSLRSFGGLHELPHLQRFRVEGSWCVEMDKKASRLLSPQKRTSLQNQNELMQGALEAKTFHESIRNANNNHFGTSTLLVERIWNADNSRLLTFPVYAKPLPNGSTTRCFTSSLHTESIKNADNSSFLRGYTPLPPTLQSFIIIACAVPQPILNGDFPYLQYVVIYDCLVSRILSFRHLTLLKSLTLYNCPGLRTIQGLESRPFITTLELLLLPNLDVESILQSWQGCQKLCISSSVMLNMLLLSQDFFAPQHVSIEYCHEEEISFEKSDHLQSIKRLIFFKCKIQYLPITLSDFSTLEYIRFIDCPKISGLPELPGSVQHIRISGCPVLRKRCLPNGVDWHKIQCIEHREIE